MKLIFFSKNSKENEIDFFSKNSYNKGEITSKENEIDFFA